MNRNSIVKCKFIRVLNMKAEDRVLELCYNDLKIAAEALDHYGEHVLELAETRENIVDKARYKNQGNKALKVSEKIKLSIDFCVKCNRNRKISREEAETGMDGLSAALKKGKY